MYIYISLSLGVSLFLSLSRSPYIKAYIIISVYLECIQAMVSCRWTQKPIH